MPSQPRHTVGKIETRPHASPISRSRLIVALGIALGFFVMALGMLLGGLLEGGAFVSLFTVGLFLSGVYLVYDRISQISLWGYEIKLERDRIQRMSEEAAEAWHRLERSQRQWLGTSLELLGAESAAAGANRQADERRVDLALDLLSDVDNANLLEALAEPVYRCTSRMLEAYQLDSDRDPADASGSARLIQDPRLDRIRHYRDRANAQRSPGPA